MAEIKDRAGVAFVHLMAADRLATRGRRADAEVMLREALAFYREVGASFYLEYGEALRARSA